MSSSHQAPNRSRGDGDRVLRDRLWLLAAIATLIAIGGTGWPADAAEAALPPGCSQSGQTVTCTYESGSSPFTVPAGVSSLHVVAIGGTGGSADAGTCSATAAAGSARGGPGATVSGSRSSSG